MAVRKWVILTLFMRAWLGGAFSHYRRKTRLDLGYLAEFLIFFSGKGPNNIAAFRLKIARTQVPLQPFEPTGGWNLNLVFWRPWRRRHTFGLVCLARPKWMLELEFLADFYIFCRACTHVSGELFRFEIRRSPKKLRPSENGSFWRFLRARGLEEPFQVIVGKPG